MSSDKIGATDTVGAVCKYVGQPVDQMDIAGRYYAVCYDSNGNIKWEDVIENLVVTVGRNKTLDLVLGTSANTSVRMGLKGAGTPDPTDTIASHATWSEITAYTGDRKSPSFSAASAGSKQTSSPAVFDMNGSATVAGCFILIDGSATPGNTASGTLLSAGDFTGGSKSVSSGDTISVTYTLSLTSS